MRLLNLYSIEMQGNYFYSSAQIHYLFSNKSIVYLFTKFAVKFSLYILSDGQQRNVFPTLAKRILLLMK